MDLFNRIIDGLQRNMDLRLQRQTYINANIANAETPGYHPRELNFEEALAGYMERDDLKMQGTNGEHMGAYDQLNEVQGEVIEQTGEVGPDGNTVDLDRQMAELTSNSFNYRASAKMVNKKLAMIKYVINESR